MESGLVDLGTTFGAMFVGSMVSLIIYGISCLQCYFYYLNYPGDELHIKMLVLLVWVLDSLHVAFMCHAMYHYLITGYGVPKTLEYGTWSLFGSLALNVTVAFISQWYDQGHQKFATNVYLIISSFFTKRIHDLGPPKVKFLLSTFTASIVLAHFVFGLETAVQFSIKKRFDRLGESNYDCVIPFGVFAVLSDIVIAVALVILLRRNRHVSELEGFADTNNLIHKLVVYAVERCVLTSAVAVLEVILFLLVPGSLFAFAFDFVIGKLYANSLLASLNSRRHLQEWSRHKRLSRSKSPRRGLSTGQISTGLNIAAVDSVDHDLSGFGRGSDDTRRRRFREREKKLPIDTVQLSPFDRKIHISSEKENGFDTLVSRSTTKSHMRRRSMPVMGV
ncbi:hypothetical protein VKT23_011404 [Stygiomarasmius scandens]|uniref:DUF6534 domain-containing protein n=1 Tax=Marasmiellus scandens TaxID=2682957 RepID=A0ABR1JBW8_9AGAR